MKAPKSKNYTESNYRTIKLTLISQTSPIHQGTREQVQSLAK